MPQGTVKFFNSAKGFGFIAPEEGGPDVFVHVSALQRSGINGLNDGDQVSFEIEQDQRSGKLAAVELGLIGSAPPEHRPSRSNDSERGAYASSSSGGGAHETQGGSGVVKWFNSAKVFGFIQSAAGGPDVFVHVSALERAGIQRLDEGQAIKFDVEPDRRSGKSAAVNLRLG